MTNHVHGMSPSRPVDSTIKQEKRVNKEGGGPASGARSIRFVPASKLPVNPIDWLVADYLEQNTLAVLYGGPGKGKSFFAIDLACCVATGTPFHGQAVRQGAVFYIAGEGHQGLARRLRAWSMHHRVSLDDEPLYISSGPVDMANSMHAAEVEEILHELSEQSGHDPSLIVIDTLSRNFSGDENSAADVGRFVRRADLLRNPWQATTVIVHHSGKDSERGARGSSVLKGAVDAEYELTRNVDRLITLSTRKMKDAPEPAPQTFELVAVPIIDDQGGSLSSAVMQRADATGEAEPALPALGKNQQQLLVVLVAYHREIAERLASQGRGDKAVLIPLEDWQQRCKEQGIARNRFHEAKETLISRGLVRCDWPHVFLVEPPTR